MATYCTMLIPPKLESGDTIGVIAPSRTLSMVDEKWIGFAKDFFAKRGIGVRFAKHCMERWNETGGTIEQRVGDLMEMFDDDKIKAIVTAIGGFNSNQLLGHIDYDLIAENPKIFVGYSDITALHNAIHAKTGLVTYYGPHFSTLGQPFPLDYTIRYFDDILIHGKSEIDIEQSKEFAEDDWYLKSDNPQPRELQKNPGWSVIREGNAKGHLVGGNIVTFQALVGTQYMPDTSGKVLFLEDCPEEGPAEIDRALTHMKQAGIFKNIGGLLVGRFPTSMGLDQGRLVELLRRICDEGEYPIVAGLDFGHTEPMATLPIGIPCLMDTFSRRVRLSIPAVNKNESVKYDEKTDKEVNL